MIFLALDREKPLPSDEEAVRGICLAILRDPERLLTVRALLNAVVSKECTGHRVAAAQFVLLAECGGWPKNLATMPHEQTVRNFAEGVNKPHQPEVLAAYLIGLSVLKRFGHPAFTHVIVQALVRYCEPLALFERELGLRKTTKDKVDIAGVVRMGTQLYHVMHRGMGEIPPSAFDAMLASPLLAGIQPASNDLELEQNQRHLTAIRLGAGGGIYVVSQVSVSLIEVSSAGALDRRILYLRTKMAASGEVARIASHGFMIPASKHTYLAQYHLGGQGLNISALSNTDLHDIHSHRCRGMILAVDREGEAGALGSKLMVVRAERPGDLIGNMDRLTLQEKLPSHGVKIPCDLIVKYLHDIGPVAIRLPGASTATGYSELSSWREIFDYLNTSDAKQVIGQLRAEEQALMGELQRPLRTE